MKNQLNYFHVMFAFSAIVAHASAFAVESTPVVYKHVADIAVGGQGGWDALAIDSKSNLLFMSHSDRVMVIDLTQNKVTKEIPDTPGVHCIAIASELGKAFSSNGKDNSVSVIDLKTLTSKSKVKVGENPDAIVYDSGAKEVYAFNGRGNSASVLDAKSEKLVTTIALPGKPEFAIADAAAHRIYVNIEDKNQVVRINTQKHAIDATWSLEGCESPSGISLDASHHHLFSACENQKMVMLDTETGKTLTSISTGEGTDGADFDPKLGLAFSSNGKSATVTIARADAHGLQPVQMLKTQMGARTMVLNPADHRIYLPTSDFQPAVDGKRPKPVDGTQKILVYGME